MSAVNLSVFSFFLQGEDAFPCSSLPVSSQPVFMRLDRLCLMEIRLCQM